MTNHPLEALMKTALESIKEMVDVNTIVGDPVEAPDGSVVIPVSRVSCGFAAGGAEFQQGKEERSSSSPPFGGGSGGGISVHPVGFLVAGGGQVRFLPVADHHLLARLLDLVPAFLEKLRALSGKPGS